MTSAENSTIARGASAVAWSAWGFLAAIAAIFVPMPDSDGYDGWLFTVLLVAVIAVISVAAAARRPGKRWALLGFTFGFVGAFLVGFAFLLALGSATA